MIRAVKWVTGEGQFAKSQIIEYFKLTKRELLSLLALLSVLIVCSYCQEYIIVSLIEGRPDRRENRSRMSRRSDRNPWFLQVKCACNTDVVPQTT